VVTATKINYKANNTLV